jgi:hypothetical protein
VVGTKTHHPASLPPISACHFPYNVEFFNRIAENQPLVRILL